MATAGSAVYNAVKNELEVVRPGETTQRTIRCTNLNPNAVRIHGVEIHGDEIWILTGPKTNPQPNRKYIYTFSGLSGGNSAAY